MVADSETWETRGNVGLVGSVGRCWDTRNQSEGGKWNIRNVGRRRKLVHRKRGGSACKRWQPFTPQQKNNPPFQKKDGLQKPEYVQEQYCLTLRELRTLASFLQAVLLALNHTWVTRKQTRLFQLGAIFAS